MAHLIMERDEQNGNAMAWHGLTVIPARILAMDESLRDTQGLERNELRVNGWDVKPENVYFADNEPTPWQVFRASDDKLPIGVPFDPSSYTPIYNSAILDSIFGFLDGTSHRVVSAGSVGNRSKMFCTIAFDGAEDLTVDGKTLKPYGNIFWSHDKSIEVYYINSGIMTVCANTLNMNLALGKKAVMARVKHTKNAIGRIENFAEMLDNQIGVAAEFRKAMQELANKPIDAETAKRAFAGFVSSPSGLSTRAEGTVTRLSELFVRGAGNRGETRLDALQAVTDYYSHESAGGDDKWKQFVSSEFGSAGNRKAEFLPILLDDDKLTATVNRGDVALDNRRKLLSLKSTVLS